MPQKDTLTKDLDAKEERKWNAFWHALPGWVKGPLTIVLAGLAGHYALPSSSLDEKKFQRIIHEEVGPLKAGFLAFVDTCPDKQKVKVLEAMNRYRDKVREGD